MYCAQCSKSENHRLNVSKKKRDAGRCEHCGYPINEKGERLNRAGMLTDSKGFPKPVRTKFVPRRRRYWAPA